jgi:hypothetical protein
LYGLKWRERERERESAVPNAQSTETTEGALAISCAKRRKDTLKCKTVQVSALAGRKLGNKREVSTRTAYVLCGGWPDEPGVLWGGWGI